MSTPPPFPPASQPPNQPGGFGQGGGIASPPWQTGGGGPSGLTSSPAPQTRSKLPLIIGALVVVALLVVVGVLVLRGDDDDTDGRVESAAAGRGLETVLRDGSYDDTGVETLRACPLGDLDELTAAVAEVIEIDDAVVDGDAENGLTEEGDFPGFVSCQINATDDVRDGPTGLYFQAILDPPRSYERYVEDFSGDFTSVDFEDSVEFKGGEVFLYCAEANTDEGYTGCDADWVNTEDNLALNVFIAGEDLDTENAFTALKAVISTMADNLAESDTEES